MSEESLAPLKDGSRRDISTSSAEGVTVRSYDPPNGKEL